MMTDQKKFRILIVLSTVIVALTLSFNLLREYVMTDVQDYLKRRLYYESVISKKGLDLHKGMHWREKD